MFVSFFTLTNNRVCLLQEVAATGWGIRSGNAGDGGQPCQQEAGHVGNHSRRKGREKVAVADFPDWLDLRLSYWYKRDILPISQE